MMKNNNSPDKNVFDTSFVSPENVIISTDKRKIEIINTTELHEYCLYDSQTVKQMTEWVNGQQGSVVFSDLDPNVRYAIRVRKAPKDDDSSIRFIRTQRLVDDDNRKNP